MSTVPKFRIDVNVPSLLMNSQSECPELPVDKGMSLPEPVYPRFPEKLSDPGPETPPDHRDWTLSQAYHKMKGWLFPYVRSRVLPGEFHPIIAYLFVEYKCNLDCWYCWAFNNKVKGMTEDTARPAIDWLHDRVCSRIGIDGRRTVAAPAVCAQGGRLRGE